MIWTIIRVIEKPDEIQLSESCVEDLNLLLRRLVHGQATSAMIQTPVRRYFERVALRDIPCQFRVLYLLESDICVPLVNAHISSAPIPTEPSTSFTVDVDLAWRSLGHVQQLFLDNTQPRVHAILPRLLSWCLYFLEAIPWDTFDTVHWPELDVPFLLLPCLIGEYATDELSTLAIAHPLPMYEIIATMLKISVKVALLLHLESSDVNSRIETVFRVLHSFYPEDEVEGTLSEASKAVTDDQVKELASRLPLYVTDKPHDLPIDHIVQLIARLSEASPRICALFEKASTPRWASHTFRVAVAFTRDDERTTSTIGSVATYLSWLFVSQIRTGKIVQIALSRRVLPALYRCITHEKRLWASRQEALPIITLLKYLAVCIVACPTTQRKARVALSSVEMNRELSRGGSLLEFRAKASSNRTIESDVTYADLWARWDWLVEAIRDVDTGEERCANPESRGRANLQICSGCWDLRVCSKECHRKVWTVNGHKRECDYMKTKSDND
ncbi:hypothetical protein BDZ89DRAFT_1144860 [Hymenopellis radicata]|nr:hypothetical protein BDZ89DRAFT_1144860 [Hymenopellis radicata]